MTIRNKRQFVTGDNSLQATSRIKALASRIRLLRFATLRLRPAREQYCAQGYQNFCAEYMERYTDILQLTQMLITNMSALAKKKLEFEL